MSRVKTILPGLTILFLNACAVSGDPRTATLSPGTDWVANSPGWAEEAVDVFRSATDYVLIAASTRNKGSWAVVLDLDETVLNNVQYQVDLELAGESYTPESWYNWTQRASATLIPGAADFIDGVNQAGGHVAFVTNRKDLEQLATENNLAKLGLDRGQDFRVLLTRATPDGPGDKSDRFLLVTDLLRIQGYADVQVVAYVGDNVGDKPPTLGETRFFCIDQGAMYGEPCARVPGPGQ